MAQDQGLNVAYRIGDIEYNVERKPGATIVSMQQARDGVFHNPHGPAATRIDEQTGIVVFEYWCGVGRGVGYVMRNADTGMVERDTRPYALRVRAGILMALTGRGYGRLTEALLPAPHLRQELIAHMLRLMQRFISSNKSTTHLFPTS